MLGGNVVLQKARDYGIVQQGTDDVFVVAAVSQCQRRRLKRVLQPIDRKAFGAMSKLDKKIAVQIRQVFRIRIVIEALHDAFHVGQRRLGHRRVGRLGKSLAVCMFFSLVGALGRYERGPSSF
ncbi:hypothetical protein ACS0Y6_22235 [Burkholderia gladioli]|uniref:hypothetical protein n=1 Tax=Burkholderia gladioli TaxID=28095 RepID=UPI00064B0AC5